MENRSEIHDVSPEAKAKRTGRRSTPGTWECGASFLSPNGLPFHRVKPLETSPMKAIEVALIEDDEALRYSLCSLFELDSLSTGAGACAWPDAISRFLRHVPDVVVASLGAAPSRELPILAALTQGLPLTRFIVLGESDSDEVVFDVFSTGADGYLLKPVDASELLNAIREVYTGGAPMSPAVARKVIKAFQRPAPRKAVSTEAPPAEWVELSDRECEVLHRLIQGYLLKEIASDLGISYWTVQTYSERIYEKLHVHSRAQAVAKCLDGLTFGKEMGPKLRKKLADQDLWNPEPPPA